MFFFNPRTLDRVEAKHGWTIRDGVDRNENNNKVVFNASQFDELGCLKHELIFVNATDVMNQSLVELELKMGEGCGPLRREWRINPPLSQLAKSIRDTQSNCSLPIVAWPMYSHYGIGSHIFQWSEAMCVALENGHRLRTEHVGKWIWNDQTYCNMTDVSLRSPWLCYFPKLEYLCEQVPTGYITVGRTAPRPCVSRHSKDPDFTKSFRSASLEYMFGQVSPLVIREAQRQVGIIFGPNGAPDDLITVHVRWGDKSDEMKLFDIQEYINATSRMLVNELNRTYDSNANIYLATEDPAAVKAFTNHAPTAWKIYHDLVIDELDQFRPTKNGSIAKYNAASSVSINTLGRGGLLSMGSLLVSLEANYFVLTTGSGFSRILDFIRMGMIDPRCGNCTRMIDLNPPYIWR